MMHLKRHPHANVIDLGVGDTTQPLPTTVTASMIDVSYEASFSELAEDDACMYINSMK